MGKALKNFWGKVKQYYIDNCKDPGLYSYEDTKTSSHAAYAACGGFSMLVFVLYYLVAFSYCLDPGLQDMKAHAEFANDFYFSDGHFLVAWMRVPYMLWHICVKVLVAKLGFPLADATSFVFAMFGVFSFAITTRFIYALVKKYTKKNVLMISSIGSLILCFVGPLCCMWFGDAYGCGSFSPNPLHNPTHMAVKGFGMLLLMAGIDVIRTYCDEETIFFKKKKNLYLYFGIALFFSTIAKPTFMYMLLPAGFIVFLIDLVKAFVKKDGKAKVIASSALKVFISCIPSLIYFVLEYCAFYFWGDETNFTSVVLTKPFEVWHMFTDDILKCIILGMCFPLFMWITNAGYFLKRIEGRLATAAYLVGMLEFILLKESEPRTSAANFAWCMMSGMVVFFAVAVVRLIITTLLDKHTAGHIAYVSIGWFLLLMHVYSLLVYYDLFREFF